MIYLCTRKTETECSAVGSALRSGRRGRAFESPHSDRERQAVKIACRFLPSQTAVKAQLIWLAQFENLGELVKNTIFVA